MPKKIVIGIPTAGYTQAESLHCLSLMFFHLGKYQAEHPEFEFFIKASGRMLTAMNRELILAEAVNIKADYCFMIDDDMVFPQDIFERLYKHRVDVVAALAFTRNPPHLPVLYQQHEGWDPILRKPYSKMEWIVNYPKNKLVEVDAVGFGCVLIDMKVVRAITPPYCMCSSGTGEDIFFCVQAKQAGFRVFSDTSTIIGHLSNPMIIGQEQSEKYNAPKVMDTLYGAYKKYGVYDVCLNSRAEEAIKEGREQTEVLAK